MNRRNKIVLKAVLIGLLYAYFAVMIPVVNLINRDLKKIAVMYFFASMIGYILVVNKILKDFDKKNKSNTGFKENSLGVSLEFGGSSSNNKRGIVLNNPFRGIFILGAAGSGKSESIALPLLDQFSRKKYAGIVYDFKFPSLANEVEGYTKREGLRHYFIDFVEPLRSYRVNPLNPIYLPNTSYAREYATAIIMNLVKESIQKTDFWIRSSIDLLTACIWYLREEHPDKCDLPHVCAMITSKDTDLLETLQKNATTAQMTISIYNAMQRGAEGQLSGVIGTLQSAIAQINTPEIMYVFGGDDFSLDINNPLNPIILTVGTTPVLVDTYAPVCSLIISVATKLMNQPGKQHSFVLLDEFPTCFIPKIEVLPNTGRSNKIATVLMCQDLSQLNDSYGKETGDVLFASCNNHFYGRVASSHTSEILSRQFGKEDRTFVTSSTSTSGGKSFSISSSKSQSIQERDILRPRDFLQLEVGQFAGFAVESNLNIFKQQFKQAEKETLELDRPIHEDNLFEFYKKTRADIQSILETSGKKEFNNASPQLNNTKTNSELEKGQNPFDIYGD